MENWLDPTACEAATWDFCRRMRLKENKEKRDLCRTDNAFARKCFAENWFYLEEDPNRDQSYRAIPLETEFRVYNSDEKERRAKLVVLVLPPDSTDLPLAPRLILPAEDVWKAAWFPYLALGFKLQFEQEKMGEG